MTPVAPNRTGSSNGEVPGFDRVPYDAFRSAQRASGLNPSDVESGASGMSIGLASPRFESVDEALAVMGLTGWVGRTLEIATEVFGDVVTVEPRLKDDPETGEQEVQFVVSYGIDPEAADDLGELHLEFLRRFAEGVPADVRREIVLLSEM